VRARLTGGLPLKPFTRCFWIRNPKITTGSVTTVPMAAWGPYSRPSTADWNLLRRTGRVSTGCVR
jgi:hypothetical protein